jgi:hypothetical protein
VGFWSEEVARCDTIEGLWLIGQEAGEFSTTFKKHS